MFALALSCVIVGCGGGETGAMGAGPGTHAADADRGDGNAARGAGAGEAAPDSAGTAAVDAAGERSATAVGVSGNGAAGGGAGGRDAGDPPDPSAAGAPDAAVEAVPEGCCGAAPGLQNRSFEWPDPEVPGTPGVGLPAPWINCQTPAGADVGPPAPAYPVPSDADNWVGGLGSAVYEEPVSQALAVPLVPATTYAIALDVAAYDDGLFVTLDGWLELWGGGDACDEAELLWSSPVLAASASVSAGDWQNECASFTPSAAHTHLTWKPRAVDEGTDHQSYVVMDRLVEPGACR